MVAVTELAGRKRFPLHIVFAVGRRDHNTFRPSALEQHSLKCGQPRRVEVLDNFHHRGGIEAGKALVAVNERAVEEPDPLFLAGGSRS